MSSRWFCRLFPCVEPDVIRPDAYTGQSFATEDGYYRHMAHAHFLSKEDAPHPYVVTRMDRYEEAV
jgi:hypothetical protein